jgi:NADH dehydrogenase
MTIRTVCVLGGTGFVGTHLVSRLARDGYRVRIPSRHPDRHRDLRVLPDIELLPLDVHDPIDLATALDGADAAINLVGILNESGNDGSGFERAHAELTRQLIAGCKARQVPRLLQLSSLGANVTAPSHYLRSKGRAELALHESRDSLAITLFKPSVIFGPGDSFINRFAGLLKLAPVLPLARAHALLSPVYVGDVVEAMARSLDDRHTFGQSYELCGPETWSLGDIVRYTANKIGRRRLVIGLPDALGWLQAALLQWLPGKPLSLDNFRSLGVDSVCSDGGFKRLAIAPTPLHAIVGDYLR